jgi:hypothetical protein
VTFETVKAAHLLRELAPSLSVRVINVTDLMVLALESRHAHAQTHSEFVEMFTEDRPICFNYHGYAWWPILENEVSIKINSNRDTALTFPGLLTNIAYPWPSSTVRESPPRPPFAVLEVCCCGEQSQDHFCLRA